MGRYKPVKNYKLNSLNIDSELLKILNEVSDELKIRNSDLARLLLEEKLKEIKSLGLKDIRFGIIGTKK